MTSSDDPPPPADDLDIPVIGAGMIHTERVDFEARMSPWPLVSLVIMGICAVVFGLQVAGGGLESLEKLIAMGALDRPSVAEGQWWRLLSAAFMHGSPDHLIGNLVMLYILGMACEHGFGRVQFLVLFLAAAAAGSLLSLSNDRPSVGASGAIFGIMGALIVLFWRFRGQLHVRDGRTGIVLVVWAVYQLALGLLNPSVDNRAHLGGLLGGILMGLILRPAVLEGRSEVATRPLTLVGLALGLTALVATALAFVPRLLP